MRQIHESARTAFRAMRPGIPQALQDIIFKCLEKDPAMRYANIAELREALLAVRRRSSHLRTIEDASAIRTPIGPTRVPSGSAKPNRAGERCGPKTSEAIGNRVFCHVARRKAAQSLIKVR